MLDLEGLKLKIFFTWAWKRKPIFCQCGCGERLPSELNTTCMDHLLEKSPYPECKYSFKNIFFCTSDCHAKKTGGKPNSVHKSKIRWAHKNYDILRKESAIFEHKLNQKIYGKN